MIMLFEKVICLVLLWSNVYISADSSNIFFIVHEARNGLVREFIV